MKREKKEKEEKINPVGSGNIFEDFGFTEESATKLTIKAGLFRKLQEALSNTPGTQTELAKKLKIPQPKISDILTGKMAGFSVERIVTLLLKLDYEVGFDARPASHGRVVDLSGTARGKRMVRTT